MPRDDAPSTKPLLDKLGVKAGIRVAVIDVDDDEFMRQLAERAEVLIRPRNGIDIVFLGVERSDDMRRLAGIET